MSSKAHIPIISAILRAKGVKHIVISPGSRNAPLIQAFYSVMPDACHSIVDERSAAYFALGIAIKTQNPVVVVTTSGTAVLNLSPAVAEAYHQGVPLILLTADRPVEWINQQDNQSINQQGVFFSNCKASFELPVSAQTDDEMWYTNRIVNEAYNIAVDGKPGPVHINIPLQEPLYDELPVVAAPRLINYYSNSVPDIDQNLINCWNSAKGILVVCGQNNYNEKLQAAIDRIAFDSRVVVLSESISNIKGNNILQNPDLLLHTFGDELRKNPPDLVVYFGGQVVSKRLKDYLRELKKTDFWHISKSGLHTDTFKLLNSIIKSDTSTFLNRLFELTEIEKNSDFASIWDSLYQKSISKTEQLASNQLFCDLWVFNQISKLLTNQDMLFAGNSSVVRYLQYFQNNPKEVYSNRGTSGIDGCISTSVGIATATTQKVITIVGDLSFVYDSNGLWNRSLPENLKIIVINNKGGGIFSMIDGPSEQKGFTEFFEAHHPVSITNIAKAFGINHFLCAEADSFNETYNAFYSAQGTAILEIETPSEVNTAVFRNFMQKLKIDE
jgi:2-succinyl-5-enolpyruvyl-6-hydroxy-3-cyclohexene-1-carboxylate synthase